MHKDAIRKRTATETNQFVLCLDFEPFFFLVHLNFCLPLRRISTELHSRGFRAAHLPRTRRGPQGPQWCSGLPSNLCDSVSPALGENLTRTSSHTELCSRKTLKIKMQWISMKMWPQISLTQNTDEKNTEKEHHIFLDLQEIFQSKFRPNWGLTFRSQTLHFKMWLVNT